MNTALDGCSALKIVRVVEDDTAVQEGMGLHRNPIKQCGYRPFPCRRPCSPVRCRCIGFRLNLQWSTQRSLGAQEHDIVSQRQAYGLVFHESLNFSCGNVDQNSMVGDLRNNRFVYNLTSCTSDDFRESLGRGTAPILVIPKPKFYFSPHGLIRIPFSFFTPIRNSIVGNAVLRAPRSKGPKLPNK